jgi:transposase
MRTRTFQLTEEQQAELRVAYDATCNVHERQSYQAVRLYGSGWSVAAISDATGYSRTSISRQVKRYQADGVNGLRWRPGGGNRSLLTTAQRAELEQSVATYRPDQLLAADERPHSIPYWTIADVSLWIERKYGVRFASLTSYRHVLRAAGLTRQRVTSQYRSRPTEATIAEAEILLEKK